MKQNRITSEQLLKLMINESEEISKLNKSIIKSSNGLNEIIIKKLNTPVSLSTVKFEQKLGVFYTSLDENNKYQENFLKRFEKIFQKERKSHFWLKFGFINSFSLLIVLAYFSYNFKSQVDKLESNQSVIIQFFNENQNVRKAYDEWHLKALE